MLYRFQQQFVEKNSVWSEEKCFFLNTIKEEIAAQLAFSERITQPGSGHVMNEWNCLHRPENSSDVVQMCCDLSPERFLSSLQTAINNEVKEGILILQAFFSFSTTPASKNTHVHLKPSPLFETIYGQLRLVGSQPTPPLSRTCLWAERHSGRRNADRTPVWNSAAASQVKMSFRGG